ncbi:MAG TPA: methyltransferase [Verrucomicrobiae bacterium]|nr:methyltransferase [Verrucomicrobiae bacterium]
MITADDLLKSPLTDPTSIYRYRDGLYASDVLTAAICHLDFFNYLEKQPADARTIGRDLNLKERPLDVLLTLFTSMRLLEKRGEMFHLTLQAKEHICKSSPWSVAPYFASVKDRPVCLDIVEVLRTGKPTRWASLRNEKEWAKAMENPAFASQFTAAMDCRGVYLAPALARAVDCSGHHHLLDIAGGSGIYACAFAAIHPNLNATVLEKSPVDRIANESIAQRGFSKKVSVKTGDMFQDSFPTGCDIHLFSNVLHDWDCPEVEKLIGKSFASLPPRGLIVIHDAHIDPDKTGPLAVAAYSALLMTITEGKCYSQTEMEDFLQQAGFSNVKWFPTAADRSGITAQKP